MRAWFPAGCTIPRVEPTFTLFQLKLAEVLTTGYGGKAVLDLALNRAIVLFPCLDYFEHGWGRRWVAFFLTIIVEVGIVVSKKSILDHDLRSKKAGQ